MSSISVIIPAYNAQKILPRCLQALRNQTLPPDEIIVADDGSTDNTASVATKAGADKVLRLPHRGPAAARNAGVEAAKGDIVLFTDADCEPAPDWVEKLAAAFQDPEVVGAKGTYRTRQRELVARFVQIEYEDKYDRMARQEHIDFIDTYSAAYRRDVFLQNGGFDPIFITSSVEDQEFSFRLARKGYKLVFVPEAIVYHHHDATLVEYFRRKFGIGYWKALLLRWHPEKAVKDSHTPQVLKLQILLLGLSGLGLLLGIFRPEGWLLALGSVLLFLLSAVPFILKTARKDPPVALIAPAMLAIRAFALGLGLLAGFLRFGPRPAPRQAPISGLNRFLKRIMDIVGATAGLIFSAPIIAILAVLIKLDSPGPVFFIQERVGENGRIFRIIKLRTMVTNAEELLEELIDINSLEQPAFKIPNDPRVTRIGRFLRRWSLDELPQFWNVLKGEMSLVGPRPEEVRIVRLYNDWHRRRLAVKPGITGPMQVSGRGDLPLDERVRLELEYIENYSLWKDLVILFKTIPSVISGKGAY